MTAAVMDMTMNEEHFYVCDGKIDSIGRVIEGRHAALKCATDGIKLSEEHKRLALDFLERRRNEFAVIRRTETTSKRTFGTIMLMTLARIELVKVG